MRFIEIRCGIGGFRVSLEDKGYTCVGSWEDRFSEQKLYSVNFFETKSLNLCKPASLPNFDIMCAQICCDELEIEGYSFVNNNIASCILHNILEIAEFQKPLCILIETSSTLLKNGLVRCVLERHLQKAGYIVEIDVLNPCFFGVPLFKERAYLVCLREHAPIKYISLSTYRSPWKKSLEVFLKQEAQDAEAQDADGHLFVEDIQTLTLVQDFDEWQPRPLQIGFFVTNNTKKPLYSIKGCATLNPEDPEQYYYINGRIRFLSFWEKKALMGFPRYFGLDVNDVQVLASSVMPHMITSILNRLIFNNSENW